MRTSKTILIVEDNIVNRMVLCNILKEGNYLFLQAENGQVAMEIVESQHIDLILLDILMPVMDGHEFLRRMNQTGLIATIPVIVMTGADGEKTEVTCLNEGASDFLKKPYNKELVCHRVASILRLWDNATMVNRLETDKLTGLYNKEFFLISAEEFLSQTQEECVFLYYDVEEFKMVNTYYGKPTGDKLLCYIASFLSKTIGANGICGRLGGDIFGVIVKDAEVPVFPQEEVRNKYAKFFADSPVKGVKLKCGVYHIKDKSVAVSDMLDRAKIAVESIKHRYGLYYAVYDESFRQKAVREHQLVNYMEDSLKKGEFLVYLQPKHSTQTGAISGAEALVRWVHPELGFISPGEFIPLFEKNGFIVQLDYFVWKEVCHTLRRWLDKGIKPVPVSVNASRADFLSPDLPEKIESLVEYYDVDPELLHVEVTESAYTDNPEQIIAAVSVLRDMGFKIEMDDFGSGYSSLNMLSELPIDILKLDMRFIQSGTGALKDNKKNILGFIVSLSKWLQLPTVAEGVETDDEVQTLKAMGCNFIQGYYFAKPMTIDAFETYMQEHREAIYTEKEKQPDLMTADSPVNQAGDKPLVLVVEDVESNRNVMKALLSSEYRIHTEENGKLALDYIKEHDKEISCILLDLLMPVMDGFQLLEILHADENYKEIPVIITTETGSNSELRALNLGAHSFVAKPYNPDVLRHHVKKAVEEKNFAEIRKQYERNIQTLYQKAYVDELTGFLNRNGLKKATQSLSKKQTHAFILLDLDDLKGTNDACGHPAGDEALEVTCRAIRKETRSDDILSRIGGDELVVILKNMNDRQSILQKAEQIISAIHRTKIPETERFASCSAGISLLNGTDDMDNAYSRADKALYRAKAMGKGTCVFYDEDKE